MRRAKFIAVLLYSSVLVTCARSIIAFVNGRQAVQLFSQLNYSLRILFSVVLCCICIVCVCARVCVCVCVCEEGRYVSLTVFVAKENVVRFVFTFAFLPSVKGFPR